MAELTPGDRTPESRGRRLLFYIGASALGLTMSIETLAVIGRHVGLPLLGAIELIQAAILIAASAAIVIATLNAAHATVHLITDRAAPHWRDVLAGFAAALSALFFIGLAVGAAWLTADYWHADEESELLHVPFRPLRVVTVLASASVALWFVANIWRRLRGKS